MNQEILIRIFFAFLSIIAFSLYPILNHRGENARIIKLWIDDWIPLVPVFSVPYLLYIPFLIVTLVYFIFFTNLYRAISISFIFCLMAAYCIYYFYQTTVVRPEISNTDIFSRLVIYIYSKDQPYNCFPSLHTALSVISLLYWIQVFPGIKLLMGTFVLLILISTVTLKQHYLPDVFSGIILAIVSFYISR